MYKKILNILFCFCFFSSILIPLIFVNLKPDVISVSEKRKLAQFPQLYIKDSINDKFIYQFEEWFNDNIGGRSEFVALNANIEYYLFNQLQNSSNMYVGPNGEFNYATSSMLNDYQHLNLRTEERLKIISQNYEKVNNYLRNKNIDLYYFQCYDKHSIYPEQFPKSVLQYGDVSKTDQAVKNLIENTTIKVINCKEELISNKTKYQTYSRWGDATHWTTRGAYIGYLALMNKINENNNNRFKILSEKDYDLSLTDMGVYLFGSIHREELLEKFEILNPNAKKTNNKLTLYSADAKHLFYTNDYVDNKVKVLVLGDSYFEGYLIDDLAESFYEVIFINGDYTPDFINIIDEYEPNIVIIENAERCDRTSYIRVVAEKMEN